MGDDKQASAKAMAIDTALVRELAELLGETGLSEIEVEDGERKIRVARGVPAGTPTFFARLRPSPHRRLLPRLPPPPRPRWSTSMR